MKVAVSRAQPSETFRLDVRGTTAASAAVVSHPNLSARQIEINTIKDMGVPTSSPEKSNAACQHL